jgi:K+-transporting ATPase c subunit
MLSSSYKTLNCEGELLYEERYKIIVRNYFRSTFYARYTTARINGSSILGKSNTTSSFIIGDVVLEKNNRDDDLCTHEKLSVSNKDVFEENDEEEDDEEEDEEQELEEQEEENSSAPLKMDETSASAIDGKKRK